jgi:uncharacterized protein YbcV (DUF1398 family)
MFLNLIFHDALREQRSTGGRASRSYLPAPHSERTDPAQPTKMNTELITQAAQPTLSGAIPFPQIVAMLLEAGVESYHVDYLAMRKTFYSLTSGTLEIPIPLEGLAEVATGFDANELRANIRDSQQHHQSWHDFSIRAMKGGVQGYFAFLRGERVTYFGRQGDQHTEWFPGAGPNCQPE